MLPTTLIRKAVYFAYDVGEAIWLLGVVALCVVVARLI